MKTITQINMILALLVFALCPLTMNAQTITTIFADDFSTDLSAYTVTQTGTSVPAIQDEMLRMPNVSGENARTDLTAGLTSYAAPFNTKLELIEADSIVWTLNIRHNYNGRLTGIDDASSRGIAVVLIASSADLSTADGYAIVNGGVAPIDYRLVKFAGGLRNAANITILQEGQTLTDNRVYMSLKVVFIPSTKTWKVYDRLDGAASGGSFLDPSDETTPYIFAGSVVDDTHTNKVMAAFGFTHKYSATTSFNLFADNYSLTAYTTSIPTGVSDLNTRNFDVWVNSDNRIAVQQNDARVNATMANVYNISGQMVYRQIINTQTSVLDCQLNEGIYLLKIGNEAVKVII